MTNPYDHSGYTDSEEVAREQRIGNELWRAEQARNLLRQMAAEKRIRDRAKHRRNELAIWVILLVGAAFAIWRYLYLNYLWQ